jgi:hypothetical protein
MAKSTDSKAGFPTLPPLKRAAKPNTALPAGEHFYFREKELSWMAEYLISNEITPSVRSKGVILSSTIPGTGRTQLAATFCRQYRYSFGGILWFNAATDEQFRKSCFDNARELGLVRNMKSMDFQQHIQALRDYLGSK